MASFSGTPDRTLVWKHTNANSLDLSGKKVAVIGGTGGLGRSLSRVMASRGAQVTVVGQTFRDQGTPGISFIKADLSLMREASRIGEELPADGLDLVVLTTGIIAAPKREETAEGIERDMAVSYLSRLALLRRLAPRLGQNRPTNTPKTRVFIMGFPGTGEAGKLEDLNAESSYKAMAVHMNTVAGNEMLVLDSVHRYPHLEVFGLNPGLIKTNIRDNYLGTGSLKSRILEGIIGLVTMSAERYGEKLTPALFAPELNGRSGAMFNQKGLAILSTPALTKARVESFLEASEALVKRALEARLK
jgi:NAD(P)-dependent dehydrogenase (short-subunit alcohol dehydrogenase family)